MVLVTGGDACFSTELTLRPWGYTYISCGHRQREERMRRMLESKEMGEDGVEVPKDNRKR